MVQEAEMSERIPRLSSQELKEVVFECERLITKGTAKLEDYEAFVLSQQELARRTWG